MQGDGFIVDRTQSAALMAQQVLQAKATALNAYQQIVAVRNQLQHAFTSGGDIDWTSVETLCGVQASNGQTLYTFFDGAKGAMEGTLQNANFLDLITRVFG